MSRLGLIAATTICLVSFLLAGPASAKDKSTTLVFPSFLHTMGVRKATKFHLMLYTRNRVKVRSPEGMAAVRLRSWDDANTKDDDDEVTGYGVNSGANVIIYNKSMTSLGFYGLNERGQKKLNRPTAITANELGDVYVADTGNHRVVRLFNPHSQLEFVEALGRKGTEIGEFDSPQGIAIDNAGNVYVSDTENHRIQVIRPGNQFKTLSVEVGLEKGQLWHPTGIAVTNGKERWSHYRDAFFAVVDQNGDRLQKFTLDGQFLREAAVKDFFGKPGTLRYPAIDYYSNIWVTDIVNHCVHKFDRHLNYLTSFGKKGGGDREFDEPRGIAIYKRFGQVFIAEKESAQYYWVGTDIFDFSASLSANQIVLRFFLTEPSFLTATVVTPAGDKKQNLFQRRKVFSGWQEIYFNAAWQVTAKDAAQNSVSLGDFPSGKYLIKLKVEATYSSINYFAKEVETTLSIP